MEDIKEEQSDLTKEEIMEIMRQRTDYQLDLDNIKPQKHIWVDRGAWMSCEGADHPNHRSYKVKK